MITIKYSQQVNESFLRSYMIYYQLCFCLPSTHCQPALRVQASVDYYLVCDDPVSHQSFVSWVKRQCRLVEFRDVLFSKQYTSRSTCFSLGAHSYSSGCTESSMWRTSKGLYRSLGTPMGLLPPNHDVQSALVCASSIP